MTHFNHYVHKAAIARGLIDGIPAIALCGESVLPSHQGKNAVPGSEIESRKLETCPECDLFYSAIPEKREAKIKEPA